MSKLLKKQIDDLNKRMKDLKKENADLTKTHHKLGAEHIELVGKLSESYTEEEYSIVLNQRDTAISNERNTAEVHKDNHSKIEKAVSVIDAEIMSSHPVGSGVNGDGTSSSYREGDRRMYRWLENLKKALKYG